MSSIYTLAELDAIIALWKQAEQKLAARQSYTIGDRTLTAVNLPEVTARLGELAAERRRLVEGGGAITSVQGVPPG